MCCPGDDGRESPAGSPFEASVSCDAERPARLTVENAGDRSYELRDVDSRGVDAVAGRPVVKPGESHVTTGVPNGTAVLRAFKPGSGAAVGPPVRVDVACDDRDTGPVPPADRPLLVRTDGVGNATIGNTGTRTVDVRDLDGRSRDLFSGRPVLSPDETLEITDVADGTYVVRAFDPDDGSPVAPPVEISVGDRG